MKSMTTQIDDTFKHYDAWKTTPPDDEEEPINGGHANHGWGSDYDADREDGGEDR